MDNETDTNMEDTNKEKNSAAQPSLVERIAENLGGTASAARIFGTPVERDGVTVIPVARAVYGFGGGGGGGRKGDDEGAGSGGGGGMMLTPIGYIEMKDGNTRFRTARDPQAAMKIVAVSGLFAYLTVRSIFKLLRR